MTQATARCIKPFTNADGFQWLHASSKSTNASTRWARKTMNKPDKHTFQTETVRRPLFVLEKVRAPVPHHLCRAMLLLMDELLFENLWSRPALDCTINNCRAIKELSTSASER